MRNLLFLVSVIAIALTSCEKPTYSPTGVGKVFYKYLKKGDKKLVGLCFRENKNGQWIETEEYVHPEYDEIAQDFVENPSYFTLSKGDSSYVVNWDGRRVLDNIVIRKGSVEYLGTNLYNGACFYPGDVYRMRKTDGRYVYWFDYEWFFGGIDKLVPTYCGFIVNIGDAWAPVRYQVVRNQANAMQKIVNLEYKKIFSVDYDSVFEVVRERDWTNYYYMAFKDGKMIVLNSEGEKVTRYPSVISKRLLKTKINNKPDWYGVYSEETYPKRVGTEKAGTIFVKVPRGAWF